MNKSKKRRWNSPEEIIASIERLQKLALKHLKIADEMNKKADGIRDDATIPSWDKKFLIDELRDLAARKRRCAFVINEKRVPRMKQRLGAIQTPLLFADGGVTEMGVKPESVV